MANNGPKFVSVNLNKSYGQQHHLQHYNGGQVTGAGRGRSVGGSSGGMVVLSRNRGMAPKVVPKLSIPAPLNLPSLRKEHEKYDMLGSGGSGVGGGNSGGSRPTSAGVGWTKPTATISEKNTSGIDTPGAHVVDTMVDAGVTAGSYMPPSARTGAIGVTVSVFRDIPHSADKAVVLRGEDFPTLQAARPVSSGTSQKQMDLKQKYVENGDLNVRRKGSSDAQQPGLVSMGKGGSKVTEDHDGQVTGLMKNGEYIPDPLPLVRMTPRSDWTDDERDTGHGFVEHERATGAQKSENYWDRDLDFPRSSFLPYKPIHRQYEKRVRDIETGNGFPSEVHKIGAYKNDSNEVNQEGREVDKWRTASLSRNGSQESGNYRVDLQGKVNAPGNILKENKYIPPHHGDTGRNGNGNREPFFGRRDLNIIGKQHPINSSESFNNQRTDHIRRDQQLSDHYSRFRGDSHQNNAFSKLLVGSSGKPGPMADPTMTVGRDKKYLRSDKLISEGKPPLRDISASVFDEKDLFSGDVVGIIKRKKDAAKIADIHDPVRESFEAELERVQKMQEVERQMIIEEQERALMQAQREKEEREKRILEERRLEEEAQEAAWRAEQEQLEATCRAEEQRIAREEERKRIQLEEERRKQAAKQKLLEVEARMARRQAEAEAVKNDASAPNRGIYEKLDVEAKENYTSRKLDMDSCENGKRAVENAKISGSFDLSISNRPEITVKTYPRREDSSNFLERGKASSSWRKEVSEKDGIFPSPFSNQDTVHSRSRYDIHVSSKPPPRKELHGGTEYIPNRDLSKDRENESSPVDFGFKDHRWNLAGNMDSYAKRKLEDSEIHGDVADKYGDNGRGLQNSRGYTQPTYSDHMYFTAEANDTYFSGRSRYSLRQPRVLPPPSLAHAQRATSAHAENSGQATFLDSGIHLAHEARTDRGDVRAYIDHRQHILDPSDVYRLEHGNVTSGGQKLENESGCDSQSSLSVSSAPASPPHLSHDELDVYEDSYVRSSAEIEGSLLRSESVIRNSDNGNSAAVIDSDSPCGVEDEEWTPEHDYALQQQEEYDEDETCHRENDDLRYADESTEIQKFGLTHVETELPDIQNNVVLGFDEGVEVDIPNNDFDNILESQERLVGVAGNSFHESGSINALSSEGKGLLSTCDSQKKSAGSSSGMLTEMYALDCSRPQISTAYSSPATNHIDCVDFSNFSVFNGQRRASPSVDVKSGINRTQNISPLTNTETQVGLPVKLQFGLFSGTPIPSPLPAIQIGSIQMPLHTHSPVVSSTTPTIPSQTPIFQFGQLQHSSSPSQGILSLAPQLIPSVQPNAVGHLNHDPGALLTHESGHDASKHKVARDIRSSVSLSDQQGFASASTARTGPNGIDDNPLVNSSSSITSWPDDKKLSGTEFLVKETLEQDAASENILPLARTRKHESHLSSAQPAMQSGMRRYRHVSGGRGRRFMYAMKNGHTRSSKDDYIIPEDIYELQRRPRMTVQRREYRIREKNERKPAEQLIHSNGAALDGNPNYMEKPSAAFRSGGLKRTVISKRIMKQKTEIRSSSGSIVSQKLNSEDGAVKETQKDFSAKIQNASQFAGVNLIQNASEDVDAPLQSGIVRVFKQPGIECPSDEDDFIEVRSKRQMLNDRREQREKEIKAKSLITKPMRKSHAFRQKDAAPRSQGEVPAQLSGHTAQVTLPAGAVAASQPPTAKFQDNSETQSIKPSHSSPASLFSCGGAEHDHVQMPDTQNTAMSTSHNHIDEAMRPVKHDYHVSTIGGHPNTVDNALLELPLSSRAHVKTFSGSSSIKMVSGEKIQFGALTSPVVLPPSSHVMPHGIGVPGLSQGDSSISQPFPVIVKESSSCYEKDKHLSASHAPEQDSESVDAAAAGNSKLVMSDLTSANDTNVFGSPNISHCGTGVDGDQKSPSQPRVDEFSVTLPEDLSVETTPISLWPPLPSPQSSSGHMPPHFTSSPHTRFPFYDMNPILGGPIFALSHAEESSGAQPQPQKNTTSGPGPLGSWQHHHSSVDPFYGHPGYSGPFIAPPGCIPGVQGAPMVVYNHFPPVGQYGHQLGVGFMNGSTYTPPGKQLDWKNLAVSSGDGDAKNVDVANMQKNASSMAPLFQHLSHGSPLLPGSSTVPIFDKSPFQNPADSTGQACLAPLHSTPIFRPLQSQDGSALHSQVTHGHSIDQSVTAHRLAESRVVTTSDTSTSFAVAKDANIGGVPDPSLEASAAPPVQHNNVQSSSVTADDESPKVNRTENDKKHTFGSLKAQKYSQKNAPPQHGNPSSSGYNYHGGGMAQRNNQGNEWSRRRAGFRGRNQPSSVAERGFPGVKARQVYVAKQTPST